ncbi:glycosyl transferase family 90-domain-containing protein [Mycena haematopus]|nr:glycosyl transferase family 90-domain-containing protein [Mycena haematopus]
MKSWIFRKSSKPPPFDDGEESSIPLLPLQNTDDSQGEYNPSQPLDKQQRRYSAASGLVCWPPSGMVRRPWWRWGTIPAAVSGIIILVLVLVQYASKARLPPIRTLDETADPATLARHDVDTLFARQSKTLEQASARYTLRTGRQPPPYYASWYSFAREKHCLIDEYAQIHRDFQPFYQLAEEGVTLFQGMIDRAARALDDSEIAWMDIRNGEVNRDGHTAYDAYWPDTVRHFSSSLPDMTFLMNGRDEPRVAFNYRALGARQNASLVNDQTPFQVHPHPTAEFFAHRSGCNVAMEATGFMSSANNDSGFLLASAKPGFTTDLYPILSMAKISPCFSDILFPTEYYYDRSWWAPHFGYPDNIPWDQKKSKIYWRGMSNGGMIIGSNYHHFARFKLIDIGRAHPDLMDVAITTFAETLCEEDCDRDAVMAEYNITGSGEAREDLYGYKYAIDVDGTTFSGRFLGLLRSGSLVFKSTLFEEYFNDWLRPFEHYVPVLPDLSDLVQKIEWANANQDEARLIQKRGLEVAMRVLTDDQNDCYFFGVLVEWAQLQAYAKDEPEAND